MDGLAYDRYDDGHRRFNLKTWKDALGLEPLLERPSFRVFVRLLKSRHVLFATVDDALFLFACVSVVRALLARRTAGIFLRPHGCFRDGDMKSLFKRFIYRILVRIPFTSLATMIPHFADARYATVSHTWIYDPQNWDLVDARPDMTKRTDLVDEMIAFAG